MIKEKEQIIENQDNVPLSCQVIYGEAEIMSAPICAFCKNEILELCDECENCKVYGFAPDEYLNDHNIRDCKKFELDKDGIFYQHFKHLLKRNWIKIIDLNKS